MFRLMLMTSIGTGLKFEREADGLPYAAPVTGSSVPLDKTVSLGARYKPKDSVLPVIRAVSAQNGGFQIERTGAKEGGLARRRFEHLQKLEFL